MKFKAGDKVRYTGDCSTFSGAIGGFKPAEGVVVPSTRVSGVTDLRLTTPVHRYPVGRVVGLFTSNLELIKKEEAKVTEAIKVGDKVQVDMDTPGSSFHAVEGVVEEITPGKNHGYVRITKSNSKVEAHSPAGKRTYLYGLTKLVEEQPPYEVGDKIEFTENFSSYANKGDTAVVTKLQKSFGEWFVHYKLDKNGDKGDVFPKRIKKVEPFTFKDIQKGDTIRRTKKYASGATEVREGVAEVETHDYWADADKKFILAYHPASESGDITYELLNRPEKPKHWAETKPVGAVAVMDVNSKVLAATLTKTAKDEWVHNYLCNNNSSTYTNEQLAKTGYATSTGLNWLN